MVTQRPEPCITCLSLLILKISLKYKRLCCSSERHNLFLFVPGLCILIMATSIILHSMITCPKCGFTKEEEMSVDSCQYFYKCENCSVLLKPLAGDCCVFCSYGTIKCPPVQQGASCCS